MVQKTALLLIKEMMMNNLYKYLCLLSIVCYTAYTKADNSCDPCGVTSEQRACVKKECKSTIKYKTVVKEVVKEVPVIKEVIVEKERPLLKNRVSLLVGRSPKEGLNKSISSTQATIESKVGDVLGLQYQRLLTERLSLGVIGLTSKATLLSLGLDF